VYFRSNGIRIYHIGESRYPGIFITSDELEHKVCELLVLITMNTKVKICGLTDESSAVVAAEAGAESLGMVFALSRRMVTEDLARSMVAAVRCLHVFPLFTGVFVNSPTAEVNRLADYCGLDRVQLSGDESWEYCREIERMVIKVIHINDKMLSRDIISEIERGRKILKKEFLCLLDTQAANQYGGTGQTFNWQTAAEVACRFPVYIAGGLTPGNVAEAIKIVKPVGVDVSSGVETKGSKDAKKIRTFIEAVKRADGAVS
jgi:phosphoribosylanthranilate isomerase